MNSRIAWARLVDCLHRMKERQRQGVRAPEWAEAATRCANCGQTFRGNFCPRCGQSATETRFTLRSALRKTLEVWGMGNRSLPRTLWHLVYRPGYMIGDYLEGKRTPFFPPIKLLFLIVAAYMLVSHYWGAGTGVAAATDAPERVDFASGVDGNKTALAQAFNSTFGILHTAGQLLSRNYAVGLIFSHAMFAILSCRLFRKSPLHTGLNLSECFISQIYVATQLMFVSLVKVLVLGGGGVHLLYDVPMWATFLILVYDYWQLYGYSLLRTAWKTAGLLVCWGVMWFCLIVGLMLTTFLYYWL